MHMLREKVTKTNDLSLHLEKTGSVQQGKSK